jgi:hypothetical protein
MARRAGGRLVGFSRMKSSPSRHEFGREERRRLFEQWRSRASENQCNEIRGIMEYTASIHVMCRSSSGVTNNHAS